MSALEPLEALMPQIAEKIWGQPRPGATTSEIRYGSGGRTVNPVKGRWYIHGDDIGGGPLKLLEHELQLKGRAAFDWLRQHGFPVDDAPTQNSQQHQQPERAVSNKPKPNKRLVKTFKYTDADGRLLFETCRFEWVEDGKTHKSFSQRRPAREGDDPQKIRDGMTYTVTDVDKVPYRLPELLAAIRRHNVIFFVEGEKAADRLWELGVPATTNPMGAGKWFAELTDYFKDADVVLLPDNDPQSMMPDKVTPKFHEDGRPVHVGKDHAERVGFELMGVAKRVRILELPGLKPAKEDAWDWIERGGTVDQLYDLVGSDAKPLIVDRAPKPQLPSIMWRNLDAPGIEHEWLIEDVLTTGEVSMMAGPSRHGKSFTALDKGLAVARGVPWLGNPTLRGGVIYIAAESGRGVKKRLRAYREWHQMQTGEDLPFVLLPAQFDLYSSDDHTAALLADAIKWNEWFLAEFGVPLRMIIIDTFAAATPGADENSSRDIGMALKRATKIASETGANVQLVHHMNAGGTKPRGWTGILANVDSVVTIERDEKRVDEDGRPIRWATMSKNKDGEDGRKWRFVLRQIEIGLDKKGKKITSCVCVPPNMDIDTDKEADEGFNPTPSDKLFLQIMVDAQRASGTFPPNDLKVPARVTRVVLATAVGQLFKDRLSNTEEGTPDQVRQRLAKRWKSSVARMIQYGIIGSHETFMWTTGKPVKGMRMTDNQEKEQQLLIPDVQPSALDDIDRDIQLY